MGWPIVEELKVLESEGMVAYDTSLHAEVLVLAPVLCFTSDNPRASEITNNLGPGSRKFCRMCLVSDTMYIVCSFVRHASYVTLTIHVHCTCTIT